MAFEIRYTRASERDIDEAIAFILDGSAQAAAKWFDGLRSEVESLAPMPERYAVAPEFQGTNYNVRVVHYKSHRIVYEVRGLEIVVMRVWHGSRGPLTPGDISDELQEG